MAHRNPAPARGRLIWRKAAPAGGRRFLTMRLTSRSDGRGQPLSTAVADWAAAHPDIERIWMLARPAGEPLELVAELQPAVDGEETLALWLANAGRWRRELEERFREPVTLDWFDPDGAVGPPDEARTLVYARA
jgi:hypothetical protein